MKNWTWKIEITFIKAIHIINQWEHELISDISDDSAAFQNISHGAIRFFLEHAGELRIYAFIIEKGTEYNKFLNSIRRVIVSHCMQCILIWRCGKNHVIKVQLKA
jgi:hypothetical protein